ncbi:MAG: glutaminyl-peptide cyclotransferase [Pyrinomonadaceae bacterium]|nr:glutaminyl-peptide cyclotransferase [Pyrinomonadaceae bacterium]
MRTQSAGTLALLLFLTLPACGDGGSAANNSSAQATAPTVTKEEVPVYAYEIVESYPHDPKAYTQGLVFYDGMLFESTGQYGESSLRKVELKKGKVKKKRDVPGQYFAEGMTILNGKIYQLTWQQNKGFIYDLKDLDLEGEFNYEGEGWGLTTDGQSLILSDGTNQLRFIDPTTFRVSRTISVMDGQEPLADINELEYIQGEIYANVWKTDRIARIDPRDGRILAWIDLSGLRPEETLKNTENVLNGIAYDTEHQRLYVTGKRWPKLFEIRLKKK